jgi:hypothetical protein
MKWNITIALALAATLPAAHAQTSQDIVRSYAAQAPSPPSPQAGERFFTVTHGREWSCSSCHGTPPVRDGRHASTGKAIAPLAPAANPQRLTDPAKVEKWLRRNCGDVAGRECTAQEKADILAFLAQVKP